jgi:hypothetical protein
VISRSRFASTEFRACAVEDTRRAKYKLEVAHKGLGSLRVWEEPHLLPLQTVFIEQKVTRKVARRRIAHALGNPPRDFADFWAEWTGLGLARFFYGLALLKAALRSIFVEPGECVWKFGSLGATSFYSAQAHHLRGSL